MNLRGNKMSQRQSVAISEVMKVASSPIILVGRIWGLFPFVIRKRGSHLQLKWSGKYAVYSFILGSALVILTTRGMLDDLLAGSTKSIRMKQKTGKYVTVGDISIVILIVFVGIFGTPFRISPFLSYIDCLNEVDSIIVISDAKRARKFSITGLCVIFGVATAILCYDLAMWWNIGDKSIESEFLIGNYIPFYISYYVVLLLECQYWHMIYCIQRRLQLLNGCLQIGAYTTQDVIQSVDNKPFSIFKPPSSLHQGNLAITPRSMVNVIDALGKRQTMTDIFFLRNGKKVRNVATSDYMVNLTRAYLKLCDAADCVNKCCGLSVLIILTSCLLHLVVTPYFLVLEITGRRNFLFATLQSVWLATHIARLILIVEACYACTTEASNTRPLVCKLLCYDFNDHLKKQLELFATELYHRKIEYTACGLVKIDRALITSITGAVTTYLVILIQFQKSDGELLDSKI